MTGGQQVGERPEGHSVIQIAQSMRAEGAVKIIIVTDEPEKYAGVKSLPEGIAIQHRDTLDAVQREFRGIMGTTVIIYDQTCATEKRRRRKRGTLVDPAKRVVINELVCEGCGDCGVQSNCLSVEPLETEFGRKRQINQSTCNKDYSCVKGFCPSFVTVEGGQLKKKGKGKGASPFELGALPEPVLPALQAGLGHRGGGRGRHGRHHHRPAARRGRAPRRQGHRDPGCGWPGAKGRRHLEPCADRRDAGRHPHHAREHGGGRPDHRLRPDRDRRQGNRAAHARGPHPRGAQRPGHAHGRVREERQLAEPVRPVRGGHHPAPWARPAWGCSMPTRWRRS